MIDVTLNERRKNRPGRIIRDTLPFADVRGLGQGIVLSRYPRNIACPLDKLIHIITRTTRTRFQGSIDRRVNYGPVCGRHTGTQAHRHVTMISSLMLNNDHSFDDSQTHPRVIKINRGITRLKGKINDNFLSYNTRKKKPIEYTLEKRNFKIHEIL